MKMILSDYTGLSCTEDKLETLLCHETLWTLAKDVARGGLGQGCVWGGRGGGESKCTMNFILSL